ncbi:MAG: ATP synthase subunit I [Desulfomonilaceae bacterium]
MNLEKIPRIWLVISAAVYLVGLVAFLLLTSLGFAAGFGVGGALVLLNSCISAHSVRKAQFHNKARALMSLVGGFYFRLVFLAVGLYCLIQFTQVDPIGLVIGLSVIPAGLFVMLALIYIANRRPEEA